ncbi:hypothetical protein M5E88_00145 [Akkermansia muciniphila]|nr:hypothetical protein M5E88_00145 [Akkermansia muciniphila]
MLSYCTNIHPAESWAETREALFTCVPRIRQELAAMDSPLKDLPWASACACPPGRQRSFWKRRTPWKP